MSTPAPYIIERRYGPNRDWLCARSNVDCVRTCGVHDALVFASRHYADRVLADVREQARQWPNAERFRFAVILDRKQVPPYFGSADAPSVLPRHCRRRVTQH